MTNKPAVGKPAYAMALLIAAAMALISWVLTGSADASPDEGLCFASPSEWIAPGFTAVTINYLLLALASVALVFLNKSFNFVQSTALVLPAAFILICCAQPWITDGLTASTFVVLLNILCLAVLFGSYGRRNASANIFYVCSIASAGAMWHYSMALFIPVYIICGVALKAVHGREALAALMGIIAPWWVAIGLGLVDPLAIRLPQIPPDVMPDHREFFMLILTTGTLMLYTLLMGLNNAMRVFAANSRTRAYNAAINILGIAIFIFCILDFGNRAAYCATFAIVAAVQTAQLFASRRLRSETVVSLLFLLMISTIYLLNINIL